MRILVVGVAIPLIPRLSSWHFDVISIHIHPRHHRASLHYTHRGVLAIKHVRYHWTRGSSLPHQFCFLPLFFIFTPNWGAEKSDTLLTVRARQLGDPNATWVAAELYEAFFYVQHRGQDAAGISTFHNGRVYHCKDNGMAHEVFSRFEDGEALMQNLPGWMGVSHVRYPTAGSLSAYVTSVGTQLNTMKVVWD